MHQQIRLKPGDFVEFIREDPGTGELSNGLTIGLLGEEAGDDVNKMILGPIGSGVSGLIVGGQLQANGTINGGVYFTHAHVYVDWRTPLMLPIQPDGTVHFLGNDGHKYSLTPTDLGPA